MGTVGEEAILNTVQTCVRTHVHARGHATGRAGARTPHHHVQGLALLHALARAVAVAGAGGGLTRTRTPSELQVDESVEDGMFLLGNGRGHRWLRHTGWNDRGSSGGGNGGRGRRRARGRDGFHLLQTHAAQVFALFGKHLSKESRGGKDEEECGC